MHALKTVGVGELACERSRIRGVDVLGLIVALGIPRQQLQLPVGADGKLGLQQEQVIAPVVVNARIPAIARAGQRQRVISDFLISASDLVKIPESGLARFLPDGVAVS